MKKTILFILMVLLYGGSYAQDQEFDKDIMIGAFSSGGWNLPVRITTKYITEETSPWHGYESWSAGIKISGMVSEHYRIEISPRYSWHKIGFELSPPIYDERKIYTETFELISIPVTFKRYLDYNFFISAGTLVDFAYNGRPARVDPQSGFGLSLGAGREFRINNFIIDLAPGAELHSVVPFTSEDNQQRLLFAGLRIGFSYNFPSARDAQNQENQE